MTTPYTNEATHYLAEAQRAGYARRAAVAPRVLAGFDFDLANATFSRSGDDLTVTFTQGDARVFPDFFLDEADLDNAAIRLADGTLVSYRDFSNLVDITTSAGQSSGPGSASGGLGDYGDSAGDLIDGVTRLGSGEGMGRWPTDVRAEAAPASPGVPAAASGREEPGAPGQSGGPEEPQEPETPGEGGYTARAVVYCAGSEGQGTIVFRLLEDGRPVDARGVTFQASALNGYFELPPVLNEDGSLSLTLSEAGRQALAAGGGTNLYDYITFTVNGKEYTMQAVVERDGDYDAAAVNDPADNASLPGNIVAEWHTDADGGAGGDRASGASSDEVRISSGSGAGFANGSLLTDGGSDLVEITGQDKGADNAVIGTGDGDDVISITGRESTGLYMGFMDAGDGDNRVTVQGGASAVSGAALSSGSGDDVFVLSGKNNYGLVNGSLNAGHGDNSISVSGGYMGMANAEIAAGSGNDSITVSGGGSHGIYSSSILAGDGDNVISGSGSVGASNSTIITGSGNDSVTLSGSFTYGMESGSLDVGGGHNTISITGLAGTNGSIRAGSGNDSISVTGTGSNGLYGQSNRQVLLDAGDGDNAILVGGTVGALYSAIRSGSGNDSISVAGRSGNGLANSSLDAGDGDNLVEIHGKTNAVVNSSLVSGTGNDTFFIRDTGGSGMLNSSLYSAGGDNLVDVAGKNYGLNASGISLGHGDDTVSLSATNTAAASAMYAAGNASSSVSGGLGYDVLTLEAVSTGSGKAYGMYGLVGLNVTGMEEVSITARSNGNDAYGMYAQNGAESSIGGADGSITVIIKAMAGSTATAYAMYASGGSNVISGNSVAGGARGDSVELHGNVHAENGGSNSILTGGGNDVISLDGAVNSGGLYVNAGDGFDTLILTAASSEEFTARYKDWLLDLDAKGLLSGMGIEAISVHGVANLDELGWLGDLARNYGLELFPEDANASARGLDVSLFGLAGHGGLLDALEARDDGDGQIPFGDNAFQAFVDAQTAPQAAILYDVPAMQNGAADHAELLWLTTGLAV